MVCFKATFIFVALVCVSSVLAAAATAVSQAPSKIALPPSAIASVGVYQSNTIFNEEELTLEEQAFDGLEDLVGNIVYPFAFDKLCKSLSAVNENLGHILNKYTDQALQCSNELRQIINSDLKCIGDDGTTSLITQLIFPLALQSLQDVADKMKAQTKCLDALLTGSF